MNMLALAINAAERAPLSDSVTLAGIDMLCARTKRRLAAITADAEEAFAADMVKFPVASHTDDANKQHYEVPAAFFALVLGEQRKYSCCYYDDATTTLDEAENVALAQTSAHAGLEDGMDILELGCGWGSLSLHMAGRFPNARIMSVSNSVSQREYIIARARERGFSNLSVVTADMNDFTTGDRFDRVV